MAAQDSTEREITPQSIRLRLIVLSLPAIVSYRHTVFRAAARRSPTPLGRTSSLPQRFLYGLQPGAERGICLLQSLDLFLLLLDGVDEKDVQVIVLDALDLAFVINRGQQ